MVSQQSFNLIKGLHIVGIAIIVIIMLTMSQGVKVVCEQNKPPLQCIKNSDNCLTCRGFSITM